ncbi:hypothetical protein A4A49_01751 [Nicotiana attenuata]|uniref:Uncharacterized protein n=1 Tax=Nicotiana attenuata TaxID=49451 RepID=A0A314L5U8_NICAT|nr:hypothetical protein A4A49_01751 [Nicotiana attenuata]
MVNVNNDNVVNRASEFPARAVQNQLAGKINDMNNVAEGQGGIVTIADGAEGRIAASHTTDPVVLDNGVVDCTERMQGFEQGTLSQGTCNRGSAGTFNVPGAEQIMEEGQLQQMVKDSAIAGADRLTTAKYHAVVTVVEHIEKAGIQSSVVCSKLETNIALNATGDGPNAGVTQATTTAKKQVDLTSNGEQDEGKELEGVSALVSAAGIKATFADQIAPANREKESHTNGQLVLVEKEHNMSRFSLQGVTAKKFVGVGLNTSNHEVPSNVMFDRCIKHSHNQDTLSMMSSTTKNPKGGTDHANDVYEDEMSEDSSDEPVQNLNELKEAISSKHKTWADIAEEHDEGEENIQETGSATRQGGKVKEGAVAVIEQVASPSPITSGVAAQYNLTPTNILQALVNIYAANYERQEAALLSEHEQLMESNPKSVEQIQKNGQQKQNAIAPIISLEEITLLDEMKKMN